MIMFVTFLSFQSCSGDDSEETDDEIAGCNNFESEYVPVNDALSAYAENPSPETCENYKNALLDFYDEFNDCPYWGDYYQEAFDQIQAIDCSEEGSA